MMSAGDALRARSLPELLATSGEKAVATPSDWEHRRSEILEIFRHEVYGRAPGLPAEIRHVVLEEDDHAWGGSVRRRQVAIDLSQYGRQLRLNVLIYLPITQAKVPVFTICNFKGNMTIHPDPAIRQTVSPLLTSDVADYARGARASRYGIEHLIARGYGLATVYYGDIDPDIDDGFANGVHGLMEDPTQRRADSWGAIAAWAWGLSRVLDYLLTDPSIDAKRIIAVGHSRLGKTALWAAAQDLRFAMAISNNSGCGGASLSRKPAGITTCETVARIQTTFPHWFCTNFRKYSGREATLPIDQHMLLSLIAPRPLYIASASEDLWADPAGEFLSGIAASSVYGLYGMPGLTGEAMPPHNTPIATGRIGYHIREGKHDVTAFDWTCFMDFAERHLR